jgi:hypothetical protein
VLIVNKEFLQMYIYVYLNVILKKVCTYLNGDHFFFTFPTSEGSDLLSSHVMQTPTFISKLSDGNVIFRLDVGKNSLEQRILSHIKRNASTSKTPCSSFLLNSKVKTFWV